MAVTPGTLSGTAVLVYIDGVAIGCTTGGTFTGTNAEVETTCKDDDGAITFTPGAQSWTIQVDGNVKLDAPVGLPRLAEAWKSKETVTVRMATANTVDDPYLEGEAYISNFSWTNPNNAPSTYSITFSPRGPITLFNS